MKGTLLKKMLVVIMTSLFLVSAGAMAAPPTKTKCPTGQVKNPTPPPKCIKR